MLLKFQVNFCVIVLMCGDHCGKFLQIKTQFQIHLLKAPAVVLYCTFKFIKQLTEQLKSRKQSSQFNILAAKGKEVSYITFKLLIIDAVQKTQMLFT